MVDGDSMGPGLQLFGARFLNFLLGVSGKVIVDEKGIKSHISIVCDGTVTWLGTLVVIHVLCMLM